MTEKNNLSAQAPEKRFSKIWRIIRSFLASIKLAITLLVIILVCCVIGVTIVRGERAGALIFGTIWFNGLLVLLVVNVAFCFFGRIWSRKVTIISLGMILFHLSFVAMMGGIIYNSLFYFRGLMRLTEGEALPNNDLRSFDYAERGRFFDMSRFKGKTTLVKMHTDYSVDGQNKLAAYEIAVEDAPGRKQGIIYITKNMDHEGFQYIPDREGYSQLILLHDKAGRMLYGAHIPLQSLKRKDGTYLYTTGTREGPGAFPYPHEPLSPLYYLQIAYHPTSLKERAGNAEFQVWHFRGEPPKPGEQPLAERKVRIGEQLQVGENYLSAAEVRYWVIMSVRYEPGKPIVLTSLWVGLSGMIITFIGRMARSSA